MFFKTAKFLDAILKKTKNNSNELSKPSAAMAKFIQARTVNQKQCIIQGYQLIVLFAFCVLKSYSNPGLGGITCRNLNGLADETRNGSCTERLQMYQALLSFNVSRCLRLTKNSQPTFTYNNTSSLLVLHPILSQAGDVESNPGPVNDIGPHTPHFPCGLCNHEVTWNADALQCDGCDKWLHKTCIGIESSDYAKLGGCTTCWICGECGLRNISTSLFSNSITVTENYYNPLSVSEHDSSEISIGSFHSPGKPLHESSPVKPYRKKDHFQRKALSVVNVNCQSILAKRGPFNNLVNRVKPDIIIGTESWLREADTNQCCFPTELYEVERRDRQSDPHGGVFIAYKRDLMMQRVPELETDCEILWCRLGLTGSKSSLFCAYYRPHISDEHSLNELDKSLQRIGNSSENIFLAGDFNLPNWDWKNKLIKPSSGYHNLHLQFGDILDDNGLTQILKNPSRGENVLDLFVTNVPMKIKEHKVIPGISDHDCSYAVIDVAPVRRTQKPRKIPLYNKARWDSFEAELLDIQNKIKENYNTSSINELWSMFMDCVTSGIEKFIPFKTCKKRDSLPYMYT